MSASWRPGPDPVLSTQPPHPQPPSLLRAHEVLELDPWGDEPTRVQPVAERAHLRMACCAGPPPEVRS